MTKIAINGACGRMGVTVAKCALEDKAFEIVEALEAAASPAIGRDYGEFVGRPALGVAVSRDMGSKAEALVDFSTPEASLERLLECVKRARPHVICTTGFTTAQRQQIEVAAKHIPIVLSSNMSVGVNVLFKVAAEVARALGPAYDLDIIETHHRFKKDAPSGTAKTLAEEIEKATGRKPNIAAVRSGDVVGDHRVIFGSLGDSIEIRHTASSRDIFAKGALRAADWLTRARPGLYSMRDVLA
jgi:4-hydroxy-tetrahydrodipicolinate reductase